MTLVGEGCRAVSQRAAFVSRQSEDLIKKE